MYTFDKTRRLLKKSDYDHVFAQATKLATSDFTFLYRVNSKGYARLGLALSKKMIAKAHDRNRVKRVLRETFRMRNELPAIDLIVLAKPGVHRIKTSIMISKLNQIWSKLSISCEK